MKHSLQKIGLGILTLSFVISSVGFTLPQKAEAQWAVIDAGNMVQNTITAISSIATNFSTYSSQYKEYVLDPIAYAIAKQILRQLTSSVVNWINSGFEGSPSFVTDPGGFFADIGDQLTGEFIDKNGALKKLCSPFSLNLRIALALKYRPYNQQKYACTLSTIIKGAGGAGKNFSINGFTAGDFKQGGWPAFVSLTTEPQNNYIGAYLMAEDDLAYQIGQKSAQQKDELNQGQGFLSWKKCSDVPVAGDTNFVGPVLPGSGTDNVGSDFVGPINSPGGQVQRKKVCETQTPGKVIAGALETQLGSPVRELELADEFNEIVNALFAQLVTTVLNGGLKGASGRGTSDSSSYLNQLAQEQQTAVTGQLDNLRSRMIESVETYLTNGKKYQANKAQSLGYALQAKNAYDPVIACYGTSTAAAAQVTQYVATNIMPTFNRLTQENNGAISSIAQLLQIEAAARAATSTTALNAASIQYGGLLQSQSLVSAGDVVMSQDEIGKTKDLMAPYLNDAQQKLQQCIFYKSFNN